MDGPRAVTDQSKQSFFFLLSIVMEVVLVRHHRKEKRFGPGPRNDYTSGSGSRGGFLGRFRRNKMVSEKHHDDSSGLPEHTHPEQLHNNNNNIGVARQSYGTDATNTTAATHDARGASADYRLQDTGYAYQPPLATAHPQGGWHTAAQTNPPPENYRYGDGVYQRA